MIRTKGFSKDPKVNLISIDEFYKRNDFLCCVDKKHLWKTKTHPRIDDVLFKFTPQYLICTIYDYSSTDYGMSLKEKLQRIDVAIRDGKTEYELFDAKLNEIKEERAKHKRSKKLDEQIAEMEKARKLLPKYAEKETPNAKPFESYLIDTGYKTSKDNLKNKYLVFDVETNGTRKSNDDLLSLSIYDPTTGMCYNRYFPLELQPLILTGFIHGIDDNTLADATHMTQDELNWLIDYFHLKYRVLLSYSGGKGLFDFSFVQNYCKRHSIFGFDDLKFENIKSRVPSAPYGTEGQLSKDNLCRMFGIEVNTEVHSSYNDCLLEWKLFEKLDSERLFFIGEHLYKYTPEYIIPYSYLFRYPDLVKYAGIKVPNIEGETTELIKLSFPKNLLEEIKKYPTNITGVSIEHAINRYLKTEEQDNLLFLKENKSHLKYVGSLDSKIKEIPIIPEDDGSIRAINEKDKKIINDVNSVTKKIIEHIKPVLDYIQENIFKKNKILTQELSITDDRKVLALCDLSDSNNVMEIKTYDVIDENDRLREQVTKQLYYQSNGRNTYVLSIVFDTHRDVMTYDSIVDDLTIHLYKVDLLVCDLTTIQNESELED